MTQFLLLSFLVSSLAVWRVAKLITSEEFVFGLMAKLRARCGVISAEIGLVNEGERQSDGIHIDAIYNVRQELPSNMQPTLLARGITCLWCVSFWLAFPFGLFIAPDPVSGIVVSLALSTVAIAIDKLID